MFIHCELQMARPLVEQYIAVQVRVKEKKITKNIRTFLGRQAGWLHLGRQAAFYTVLILTIFLSSPISYSQNGFLVLTRSVSVTELFIIIIFIFGKWLGFQKIGNLWDSCGSRTCSCLFSGAASPLTACSALALLSAWLFTCSRRGKDQLPRAPQICP